MTECLKETATPGILRIPSLRWFFVILLCCFRRFVIVLISGPTLKLYPERGRHNVPFRNYVQGFGVLGP